MKNKKRILPIIAVSAMLVILLASSSVVSYLMDNDNKDNVIKIGKVDLELSETLFQNSQAVVPGSKMDKNPVVTNSGTVSEYVFLKVTVPKANVTLLNENGETNEGKPKYTGTRIVELFRIGSDGPGTSTSTKISDIQTGAPPVSVDNDIYYNKGDGTNSIEGWYYLSTKTEVNTDSDVYYFGYNKALAPDDTTTDGTNEAESTITLFDNIQLKSFIEGQESGNVTVDVVAYGIQKDNLTGIDNSGTYLSDADIVKVFETLMNNLGGS